MKIGTIYGVGLGPGDPDLLSVKSDRLVRNAKHVAFFRKAGRKGQSRQIADAMLPEGDPFFYGSFMHMYERLKSGGPVDVVPAITGMSGAWTATGHPITWGDDVLTVLMGTLSEDELSRRMADTDALVVMKIGRNIDKVRAALRTAGKFDDAWIVEFATMPNQTVSKLSEAGEKVTPYFSIIVVHGQGRRP